jgi:alpha/beta superfamily hydrolase
VAREKTVLDTVDAVALEAEIDVPVERWAGVVLAHPHPTFGGNMHATVTDALFDALPQHGIATVRFNFRGVGASGGEHDHGLAERLDVVAAIDLLTMFVDGPMVLSGYSFGADVSLCVIDPRITGWYAVAPPLRTVGERDFLAASDPRPKHLAIADHDQYNPPDAARAATIAWRNTELTCIAGADHFLNGRLAVVTDGCVDFVRGLSA